MFGLVGCFLLDKQKVATAGKSTELEVRGPGS